MNRRVHWITAVVLPILAALLGSSMGKALADDKWQKSVDEIRVACGKQTETTVEACLIARGATI